MSSGKNVRRALHGKMTGDTTLRNLLGNPAPGYAATPTTGKAIYSEIAPATVPDDGYPYIVFFQTSGVPIGSLGTGGELENDLWTIKAISRNPWPGPGPGGDTTPTSALDAAEDVQVRLDTLLTDGAITISGASVSPTPYLRRESDISYSEEQDGVVYYHRGGLFRVMWQ